MQLFTKFVCLFLLVTFFEAAIVQCEPEPMARPTRPKVFTSPEELRRYLDLVKDYYSMNGKARYGKRGDYLPSVTNIEHPWDALRLILEARRQMQQEKQEKYLTNIKGLYDFDDTDKNKHTLRIDAQPIYFNNAMDKFYNDVQ